MVFTEMSTDLAGATSDARKFTSLATMQGTDYLNGLTPQQLGELLNWNSSLAPVPTLSQWNLAGLAGLLGLAGLAGAGAFRRRSRT